jgi:hypothetical protein
MKLACNYAVARFLPYPETGEFVNVGVLLACPTTGFLGFQIEDKRRARVHKFFPELQRETYHAGLFSFTELVRHFRAQMGQPLPNGEQYLPAYDRNLARLAFAELTRQRESLFRFGPTATVLATDPAAKLKELFKHYVRRQFAQGKEFQEKVMAQRLRKMLTANHLSRFYEFDAKVGSDDYHVTLPVVHFSPDTHRAERVIKPLDLNKRGPTEILEHGDQWLARIRRLRDFGVLPPKMLFTVLYPHAEPKKEEAAHLVAEGLRAEHAFVLPYDEEGAILDFAKIEDAM